jgi:hypothetical protein
LRNGSPMLWLMAPNTGLNRTDTALSRDTRRLGPKRYCDTRSLYEVVLIVALLIEDHPYHRVNLGA